MPSFPLPIIVVHDRAQALAARAAAASLRRPLRIETPGDMAGVLGPGWMRAFLDACIEDDIALPGPVAFHCGDAPGLVLAAFALRLPALRFEPGPDARPRIAEALAQTAAAQGIDLAIGAATVPVWRFPPPSARPDEHALTQAARRWLSGLPSAGELL